MNNALLLIGWLVSVSVPVPPLPSPLLPSSPIAAVSPVEQLLATPAPAALPGGAGSGLVASPAPAPDPAPVGQAGAPAPGPAAPGTPPPVPTGAVAAAPAAGPGIASAEEAAGQLVQAIFDSPLGPTPPVIGLLLIALSIGLAVQRRRRQLGRDRALEEAKMHFLKVASHELRTPLTVIGGYVSMAADGSLGDLPERMQRALPTLHEEVDQLERLVEQMLLATRLDEGLLSLERRRLDLREVATAGLQAVPAAERRRLTVDLPAEPVPVVGDRASLQLVVRNLVENALKYSPDDREVRLSLGEDWRRARLSVSDRGIGIRRDDLRMLFTRFGRIVNAENSHVFGSGLGLYLSRGIARLHDGDLTAQSAEGQGSTFTLELPLAVPTLRRLARRFAASPTPESPAPRAGVP